jgi:hypothetical protein
LIFWRQSRHRDRAFDHVFQCRFTPVGGGDHRLLLADKNPQAQIARLRTLQCFDCTQTATDGERGGIDQHGIGSIGTRAPRGVDQGLEQRKFSRGGHSTSPICGACKNALS